MNFSALSAQIAFVLVALHLALAIRSEAQVSASFSDLDIEYGELKVAFENVFEENHQLRQTLSDREKVILDMRKNLAESNGECEIFKRQALELRLRIEALGFETAGSNSTKLEQRLLAAVRELRYMADEKKKITQTLIRQTDAIGAFVKSASVTSPEARLALEVELRSSSSAIGAASRMKARETAVTPSVSEGLVISTKDDLALIVINIGSKHGVRLGMPFDVYRSEQVIGAVRVVDVREEIAGAIVQNLKSDKVSIKVSDHLKVDSKR